MIGQEGALELQQLLVQPPDPFRGHLRMERGHQLLRLVQRKLGHHVAGLGARVDFHGAAAAPAITCVGDYVDLAWADVIAQRAHALNHYTPHLLDHDEHIQ
eukprot:scaffold4093_cov192-Isochrysis_galbana.AAC.2